MARSPEDLKLLMEILAQPGIDSPPPARGQSLTDFRVAAWLTDPGLATDSKVLLPLE